MAWIIEWVTLLSAMGAVAATGVWVIVDGATDDWEWDMPAIVAKILLGVVVMVGGPYLVWHVLRHLFRFITAA